MVGKTTRSNKLLITLAHKKEGLMFWKWQDVDGVKQKQYYITHLSLTPITLPSEVETFVQYKEEDDEPI